MNILVIAKKTPGIIRYANATGLDYNSSTGNYTVKDAQTTGHNYNKSTYMIVVQES